MLQNLRVKFTGLKKLKVKYRLEFSKSYNIIKQFKPKNIEMHTYWVFMYPTQKY